MLNSQHQRLFAASLWDLPLHSGYILPENTDLQQQAFLICSPLIDELLLIALQLVIKLNKQLLVPKDRSNELCIHCAGCIGSYRQSLCDWLVIVLNNWVLRGTFRFVFDWRLVEIGLCSRVESHQRKLRYSRKFSPRNLSRYYFLQIGCLKVTAATRKYVLLVFDYLCLLFL